jgi:hypothetical protein
VPSLALPRFISERVERVLTVQQHLGPALREKTAKRVSVLAATVLCRRTVTS